MSKQTATLGMSAVRYSISSAVLPGHVRGRFSMQRSAPICFAAIARRQIELREHFSLSSRVLSSLIVSEPG